MAGAGGASYAYVKIKFKEKVIVLFLAQTLQIPSHGVNNYMFILFKDSPNRRYGTIIGMECGDRGQLEKQKGIFAFLSIFGFVSETGQGGCPTGEVFKGEEYI